MLRRFLPHAATQRNVSGVNEPLFGQENRERGMKISDC